MTRKFAVGGPETRHGNARAGSGRQVKLVPTLHTARWCVLGCLWAIAASSSCGQEAPVSEPQADAAAKTPPAMLQPAEGWLRVTKDYDVWVDYKQKQVIAGGHICLREGLLEMFACPKGTKEHESIVVGAHARPIRPRRTGGLGCSARPARPVRTDVQARPRDGSRRGSLVEGRAWRRAAGEGSGMGQAREDGPGTGVSVGVCRKRVLDRRGGQGTVSIAATAASLSACPTSRPPRSTCPSKAALPTTRCMFAAFTERIPPRDTPVLLILTPKLEKTANGTKPTEPRGRQRTRPRTEPKPAATDTPDAAKAPAAEPAKDGIRESRAGESRNLRKPERAPAK